jgi:hypothetical protein
LPSAITACWPHSAAEIAALEVALERGAVAGLLRQCGRAIIDLQLGAQDEHRDQALALGRLLLEHLRERAGRDQLFANQELADGERRGQGSLTILVRLDIGKPLGAGPNRPEARIC